MLPAFVTLLLSNTVAIAAFWIAITRLRRPGSDVKTACTGVTSNGTHLWGQWDDVSHQNGRWQQRECVTCGLKEVKRLI